MSADPVRVFSNRDSTIELTMKYADGSVVSLAAGDFIRCKIGNQGGTPVLDLRSGQESSGGSSIATANPAVLTLSRTDLASLRAGIWDVEILLYRASASHYYHSQEFFLNVQEMQGGDLDVS